MSPQSRLPGAPSRGHCCAFGRHHFQILSVVTSRVCTHTVLLQGLTVCVNCVLSAQQSGTCCSHLAGLSVHFHCSPRPWCERSAVGLGAFAADGHPGRLPGAPRRCSCAAHARSWPLARVQHSVQGACSRGGPLSGAGCGFWRGHPACSWSHPPQ